MKDLKDVCLAKLWELFPIISKNNTGHEFALYYDFTCKPAKTCLLILFSEGEGHTVPQKLTITAYQLSRFCLKRTERGSAAQSSVARCGLRRAHITQRHKYPQEQSYIESNYIPAAV